MIGHYFSEWKDCRSLYLGEGLVCALLSVVFVVFLVFSASSVWADSSDLVAPAVPAVLDIIAAREAAGYAGSVVPSSDMKVITSPDVFSVSVTVPLPAVSDDNSVEPEHLNIATNFYRHSSSVDKRIFIDAPDSKYMFTALLNLPLGATPFTNEVIEKKSPLLVGI